MTYITNGLAQRCVAGHMVLVERKPCRAVSGAVVWPASHSRNVRVLPWRVMDIWGTRFEGRTITGGAFGWRLKASSSLWR